MFEALQYFLVLSQSQLFWVFFELFKDLKFFVGGLSFLLFLTFLDIHRHISDIEFFSSIGDKAIDELAYELPIIEVAR